MRTSTVRQLILAASGMDGALPRPCELTRSQVHIFRSASIIWGAVGPQRFFVDAYRHLYWGFLLGFLAPLIPWLLHKRLERLARRHLPRSVFSQTVVPIILSGAIAPPGVPTNVRKR